MAISAKSRRFVAASRFFSIVWLPLALTVLSPRAVFGLGMRIPNQDAEAIARGNAFVATADNTSAMYYNPAGITQLQGQNFQVGSLFYLNIYVDYDSPAGQRTENNHNVIPVPQLSYSVTLQDVPLSFGLGVYAPFGLGVEWPDNAPFRDSGLQAKLTYLTINPVVAWRPHPTLSLAIGPTFDYSDVKLRRGVFPLPAPFQFKFEGDNLTVGFDAGLLWQPHPMWSFGAKYFSQTTQDYEGTASFNPAIAPDTHTKAHVDFPQIVSAGVSFRPTTNWNFEFDFDWTDWDRTKNLVLDKFGPAGITPLNWQSSFFYEVGVTRQLPKGYFVSVGYFFSQASTPDKNYTPLVPDTDLHVGSLGFGRKGQHWNWALAGQLIGGDFRTVTGASDPNVNGRYRIFTPTVSFSVAYHF